MKKLYLFLLLHILCTSVSQVEEKTFVVYSTNDMHGTINTFPQIVRYMEQERKTHPNSLLLSGGDMFSGNPVVDLYPQRGMPIIKLMNRAGYQYAVPGNHEFDFGQEALTECMKQASFQLICANMQVDTTVAVLPQPLPYAIFETEGIKVAILGLIETSHQRNGKPYPSTNPTMIEGITFSNPIETALKYRHLRQECDIFIALTHIGYDSDKELAQAMPELDAIIGGHTHTLIENTRIENGVLIAQGMEKLNYINKVTFTLKDGKIVRKETKLTKVEQLKEKDIPTDSLIHKFLKEMPLEEALAQATAQFDGMHPLGALMTDAINAICHTDIAFQNAGGIRIGTLYKGDITLGDVFRLDPFRNGIWIYEMTPEEIRRLLKSSHQKGSLSPDLLPAGMKYTLYTHDGEVTRITLTDQQGRPLDEDKKYSVGMNEYIAVSYDLPPNATGRKLDSNSHDILTKYLKQQKEISPQRIHRATVVEE